MKPVDKAAETGFWDRYIAAHSGHPLRTHSANEVRAHLTEAGRDPGMQGWVYRQLVHALQLLFAGMLEAP